MDAPTASGLVTNGYSITANGMDEYGEPVSGYVLGKGDVCIMNQDGRVSPGGNGHNMVLHTAKPTAPNVGDVCFEAGMMKTWYGTGWKQSVSRTSQLLNDSGYALNSDVARDYTTLELFNQTVGNLEEIISEV